jgi:hypothetical protein
MAFACMEGPPCDGCGKLPCECSEPDRQEPAPSLPDEPAATETSTMPRSFNDVVECMGLNPYTPSSCCNCKKPVNFNCMTSCTGCKRQTCNVCAARRPCCWMCYKDTLPLDNKSEASKSAKRLLLKREADFLSAPAESKKHMLGKTMPSCVHCPQARAHFCEMCGARKPNSLLRQDV